jgi:hypothetical protein
VKVFYDVILAGLSRVSEAVLQRTMTPSENGPYGETKYAKHIWHIPRKHEHLDTGAQSWSADVGNIWEPEL